MRPRCAPAGCPQVNFRFGDPFDRVDQNQASDLDDEIRVHDRRGRGIAVEDRSPNDSDAARIGDDLSRSALVDKSLADDPSRSADRSRGLGDLDRSDDDEAVSRPERPDELADAGRGRGGYAVHGALNPVGNPYESHCRSAQIAVIPRRRGERVITAPLLMGWTAPRTASSVPRWSSLKAPSEGEAERRDRSSELLRRMQMGWKQRRHRVDIDHETLLLGRLFHCRAPLAGNLNVFATSQQVAISPLPCLARHKK